MLARPVAGWVHLRLQEEFFEDHIYHQEEILVDVLAYMLEFDHEFVEQSRSEHPDQGPGQNESYLQLANEEEHT